MWIKNRNIKMLFFLPAFFFLLTHQINAQVPQTGMDAAIELRNNGEFQESAEEYLKLFEFAMTDQEKVFLLFNFSEVSIQLKNFDDAYAALLRANQLTPNQRKITEGLKWIESKQGIRTLESQLPLGLDALGRTPIIGSHLLEFSLILILCAVLSMIVVRIKKRNIFAIMSLSLYIIGGSVFWVHKKIAEEGQNLGITNQPQVMVYTGPNSVAFSVLFELERRVVVKVLEQTNGWFLVGFGKNQMGWVQESKVKWNRL